MIELSVSSSFYCICRYSGFICIRKGYIILGLRMPKKCCCKHESFICFYFHQTSGHHLVFSMGGSIVVGHKNKAFVGSCLLTSQAHPPGNEGINSERFWTVHGPWHAVTKVSVATTADDRPFMSDQKVQSTMRRPWQ
jgi:hypothetical protein